MQNPTKEPLSLDEILINMTKQKRSEKSVSRHWANNVIKQCQKSIQKKKTNSERKARKQEKIAQAKKDAQDLIELRQKMAKFSEQPKYVKGMKSDFYKTKEWRSVRWEIVSRNNGKCSVCGRSNKEHGIVIHVDHIKPRSKFPELELDINNLQLLCADCNLGKGAKLQTF